MANCIYEPRKACTEEAVINFDYCVRHLNTPRGMQHMVDRVRSGRVLVQSDIDRHIEERTALPEKDMQTTVLEKMSDALDRVMAFERHTERMVANLDPDDWRFLDRSGAEQLRSEVQLYERAMERTTRVLKETSKVALQERMVSLGKAQTELMVRIMMAVMNDLGLDAEGIDKGKNALLMRLRDSANMTSRVDENITKQLTAIEGEIVDEE